MKRSLLAAAMVLAAAFGAYLLQGHLFTEAGPRGAGFTDVTDASGIRFRQAPATGLSNINPSMAALSAGVAIADYDGDGLLDLYFTGAPGALYRNLGNWRFEDVTDRARVRENPEPVLAAPPPPTPSPAAVPGTTIANLSPTAPPSGPFIERQGSAAAFADYDNDGCLDLYVARLFTGNALYRNNCDGTFTDVTEKAGVGYVGPTYGVAWGDYDRDGRLDLYLGNYFGWNQNLETRPDPNTELGASNVLYRNNGDGTFTNVTDRAGVGDIRPTLAPLFSDLDGNGWLDIYMANDFRRYSFYRNNRDGTFTDATEASGFAYTGNGMSADSGDLNGDRRPDVVSTNIVWMKHVAQQMGLPVDDYTRAREKAEALMRERGVTNLLELKRKTGIVIGCEPPLCPPGIDPAAILRLGTALFIGSADGRWTEVGERSGVWLVEWGWSAPLFDFDNDGRLDIFAANGMTEDASYIGLTNRLFWNAGNDGATPRFAEVGQRLGTDAARQSRGAAYGDLDGDGDLDLVTANFNGPPSLFRNDLSNGNHWLVVKLQGTKSNRDGVGAKVWVTAGGQTLLRETKVGSGYQSQSQLWPHFGLGGATVADVRIEWPGGSIQTLSGVAADRVLRVVEAGP